MTAKELKKKTSAESLYRLSDRLSDPKDPLWSNLQTREGSGDRLQLITLFHIGAAVVRALDDLTSAIQSMDRKLTSLRK